MLKGTNLDNSAAMIVRCVFFFGLNVRILIVGGLVGEFV